MGTRVTRLSRRTLLRGTGAAIALPVLDIMLNSHGDALANGMPLPKRIGSFFWGNGVRPDRWKPGGQGAGAAWQLSEELAPLAALKEYITAFTGMNVKHTGMGHHVGHASVLTGAYAEPDGKATVDGPSFEQVAAQSWKGLTSFDSIDLQIGRRARSTGGSGCCQGGFTGFLGGPNERIQAEPDPQKLFDRLFGNFDPTDPNAERERIIGMSILDSVIDDAHRLKQRVGSFDKHRIDVHLDGLRELERSIEELPSELCEVPDRPGVGLSNPLDHEPLAEVNAAMAAILAAALACDLSRAFTYQFSGKQSDTIFWQTGSTVGQHNLTHDDRKDPPGGNIEPQPEQVHNNVVFIMEQFAVLLETLRSTPEGDSNLLEQCVIMTGSDVADGTKHTLTSMPTVIAGRGGGALKGDYHHVTGGDNFSKIPLSCIRAVDVEAASFGKGAGKVTGHVSEIFA